MLSVGCDIQGIVKHELLDQNQTITSNLYCYQLHDFYYKPFRLERFFFREFENSF